MATVTRCRICSGLLQPLGGSLIYDERLKVWSCTECAPILETIEPENTDGED